MEKIKASKAYDGLSRLHPGQRLIADSPARFKLLCCGRKWGKTDFAAELLNSALREGKWVASLAPAYKTTRAIWEYLVPRLPADAKVNQGTLKIELPNGGRYTGWSLDTTAADSVRPFEYDAIVIDEAAFVPSLFSKWTEILLPTLSKRKGTAYFLSTPCGFNDFFKLFQMGQDPDEPLWASWKFPTVGHEYGNPHIDPAEIDMQRKLLPSRSFNQEYGASFEEDAGAIYDQFDPTLGTGNVTYEAEYNPDWPVVWGVDDGYVYGDGPGSATYHPRVVLFAQFTPQGGVNIFDEYAATGEVEEVTLTKALEKPYRKPDIAYVDSSAAQLKARIWSLGIQTVGATHKVNEGIKNVRRLICDGQGVRLMRFHPRCKMSIREHQTYRYDISASGETKPLKIDEHTCFVAGTLVQTDRGQVAIESLKIGDRVLTRDGYHAIDTCGETSVSPVITVTLNDTYSLTGTIDHPVYTENRGFVALCELGIDDIILVSNCIKDNTSCPKELYQKLRPLSTMGSHSAAILNQNAPLIGITLNRIVSMFGKVSNIFIERSGSMSAALSLMDTTFITKTKIHQTIQSTISNVCRRLSTPVYTLSPCQMSAAHALEHKPYVSNTLQRSGTQAKRGARGISNMERVFGKIEDLFRWSVKCVVKATKHDISETHDFAPTIASQNIGGGQALTILRVNAPIVGQDSLSTNTPSSDFAQVRVGSLRVSAGNVPCVVYNLSVNAVSEYFANGVLVHNCDAARYLSMPLMYGANA